MQSSALAFASICGGDLTSMIYSKFIIYHSLIGIQYKKKIISWDFFNGEKMTLQKPKIDLFDIVL